MIPCILLLLVLSQTVICNKFLLEIKFSDDFNRCVVEFEVYLFNDHFDQMILNVTYVTFL